MNQRVKQIIDELKRQRKIHSDADCARLIGIDKAELSRMMSGKRNISQRLINGLLTAFPEINEQWLRTGEGEMLKNPAYFQNSSPSVLEDNHSDAIEGNKNMVNADQTIAMLVAEVTAQRRLTEKVLEQNSELIAIIAGRGKETDDV